MALTNLAQFIMRCLWPLLLSRLKSRQARRDCDSTDGDYYEAGKDGDETESVNDEADARQQHRGQPDERVVDADIDRALGIVGREFEHVVLRRQVNAD